jgi:hypothetical protein
MNMESPEVIIQEISEDIVSVDCVDYWYQPVPAIIYIELRVTPWGVEFFCPEHRPDYLAITRQVANEIA